MNKDISNIASDLKKLYAEDQAAKRVFQWFDARQKDSWQMPVRIASYRTGLTESEVRRVFKSLDDLGCGSLVTGRKGYETRMIWDLSIRSIAAAAKGAANVVVEAEVAPGDALEDEEQVIITTPQTVAGGVTHTFKLRPDFEVVISLPFDFSTKEAERLSGFLKAIPAE